MSTNLRRSAWLLLVVLSAALSLAADRQGARYEVSLKDATSNVLHVRVTLPSGPGERILQMPVWNALYQVRDFAQYVSHVKATTKSGKPLVARKITTSAWSVREANDGLTFEYDCVVNRAGPFGASVSLEHAFLNPAQVLVYSLDTRSSPLSIRFIDVPSGWKIETALPRSDTNEPFDRIAGSYDFLADSPIELGRFHDMTFTLDGAEYRIVVHADENAFNANEVRSIVGRIVKASVDWMQDRPFQSYLFIYHFPKGRAGGGMEHAYSTAIDASADTLNTASLAGVTAHEFFHLWNVKRIRPQSLEPVDFTREQPTPALWFSEGVTSTASAIINLRAGITSREAYLNDIADGIHALEQRPARQFQSVEESSLDTWFDKYPFYRTAERSISYYNKGEIAGVMLDLAMRDATHGKKSLRDLFLYLNERYAKRGRFFEETDGIRKAVEAVTDKDFGAFFRDYVAGTVPIPYDDFLGIVGMKVTKEQTEVPDPGFTMARNFDAPPVVSQVAEGSAAAEAGLRAGMIVLSVNGKPAQQARLAELTPGSAVRIGVQSADGERQIKFRIGSRMEERYSIQERPDATIEQRARREEWLAVGSTSAQEQR